MNKARFFLMLATMIVLTACASSLSSRAQDLRLGMTLEEATGVVGSGYTTVAARVTTDGQVQAIKYTDKKTGDLVLYFKNDKLVQWGDLDILKQIPPEDGGGTPKE